MGDVQCANITIVDDAILNGQRNLSITLRNIGGDDSGVRIDLNMPSIDISINVDDGKQISIVFVGLCESIDFFAEITVGFSQSIFTVTEDDDFVQICAELLEGELGTDISIFVHPGIFGNDSGNLEFLVLTRL